jgi:hypothetical protein
MTEETSMWKNHGFPRPDMVKWWISGIYVASITANQLNMLMGGRLEFVNGWLKQWGV